jgi:hypothetical protein
VIVNVCTDRRGTMKALCLCLRAKGGGSTLTLAGLNAAFAADCCPSHDDEGATGFDPKASFDDAALTGSSCPPIRSLPSAGTSPLGGVPAL